MGNKALKNKAAVFLDIDNTLWDVKGSIPDGVHEALEKLRANGHRAYINTGRARAYIRDKKLMALPLDGIVAACGCYIETGDIKNGGDVIYEKRMPYELISRAKDVLLSRDMRVIFEGPEFHWINPNDFELDPYIKVVWDALGPSAKHMDELKNGDDVNKFSASFNPGADVAYVKKELENDVDFLLHEGEYFEAILKGTGKGFGIRTLCEIEGFDRENTYAIGDSINDLDMFAYAGHAICMGNGEEVAKNAADFVTTKINDDGIVNALKHYGLI